MTTAAGIDVAAYARLADGVRELIGLDLADYRPAQMWRRVSGFASGRGLAGVDALLVAARRDPALLAALQAMLTINVSEFFRDPDAWNRLGHLLDVRIIAGRGIRAWSAGCSLGMEPYSLAMLVSEVAPSAPLRITATDVDEGALEVARAGHYTTATMVGVGEERRKRFLVADATGWTIRPDIRAAVIFRRHDLLSDSGAYRGFDLVVCRNVVIYLTEAAKATAHARLSEALRPGGILFVGATEAILAPSRFGLTPHGPGLYIRAD